MSKKNFREQLNDREGYRIPEQPTEPRLSMLPSSTPPM